MNISQWTKGIVSMREKFTVDVPIAQVEVFLIVAENEGINRYEIPNKTTIQKQRVDRLLVKICATSEILQTGQGTMLEHAGFALCQIKDDDSVVLTEKGKQLLKELSAILK